MVCTISVGKAINMEWLWLLTIAPVRTCRVTDGLAEGLVDKLKLLDVADILETVDGCDGALADILALAVVVKTRSVEDIVCHAEVLVEVLLVGQHLGVEAVAQLLLVRLCVGESGTLVADPHLRGLVDGLGLDLLAELLLDGLDGLVVLLLGIFGNGGWS